MRSTKPATALVTLTTLLLTVTLGVAVATGHPGARRHGEGPHTRTPGNCQPSINVTPSPLTAGDPVVIFGQLTCRDGVNAAGQTVALFQHAPTGRSYVQAQTAVTESGGFYEFPPLSGVSTGSAWFVRFGGARSRAVQVPVAATVALEGPAVGAKLLTGAAVTFTGAVTAADAGYTVMLERQDSSTGNRWDPLNPAGQVGPSGAFTIAHTFLHPGAVTVRAVVVNRGRINPHNSPSASNTLFYEVERARPGHTKRPAATQYALTATLAQATVQAGQPVTVSGAAAPAPSGHTIYLERQDAAGPGFHVVEVAAVGADSTYTIAHTVYDAGPSVYRVAIPGGPGAEGAVSSPFAVTVTTAPASALAPEAPGNSSQPFGGV